MAANMARTSNGVKLNLQEAIALLIQNQAAFVSEMADVNRRYNELAAEKSKLAAEQKQFEGQTARAIAAIEHRLAGIERILRELPEAIRQKIGFKTK